MSNLLITGTSSGIGAYLSEKLCDTYGIFGVSRRLIGGEKMLNLFEGDVRDVRFLERVSQEVPELDFVLLNAGVGYFGAFESIGLEKHVEILETNLVSPIILCELLLSAKKIKKGIIFMGSIAGKKSLKSGASYAASKFGLRGFAMQIKNEYPGLGIHLINPKIVNTAFHQHSQVDMSAYAQTSLEDIYSCVENILNGKEKRFEVDL